jgi:hypothetical protein
LVLQDQHYYGIRLRADWIQTVFGQRTVELAYLPGGRPDLDRFRTNLRIPMLDMFGPMVSGEFALEWGFNWDWMIDIGFPWNGPGGYDWFRAFSLPIGIYEGKLGVFLEGQHMAAGNTTELVIGGGFAMYAGLYAGFGNSVVGARAGIGVFGILMGFVHLENASITTPSSFLKASITKLEVDGTIGILAYGEGWINVWVISARFRVWAQASLTTSIVYIRGANCAVIWTAQLAAGYSASVHVGCGWFGFDFSVSGSLTIPVSGRLLLS